mmetsp:Transcript_64947/g.101331  ORF Transcript_64947/g.101331 Transcript_64947/m.101331 type:complete len:717 (-) Transcript_64947:105-2255(-)
MAVVAETFSSLGSFWPFHIHSSLWTSSGDAKAPCETVVKKDKCLPVDECQSVASSLVPRAAPNFESITSGKGDVYIMQRLLQHGGDDAEDVQISEELDLKPLEGLVSDSDRHASVVGSESREVQEARREAARLREALQRAEEKLDSYENAASTCEAGHFERQQQGINIDEEQSADGTCFVLDNTNVSFPEINGQVSPPQLEIDSVEQSLVHHQSLARHDQLSTTAPPCNAHATGRDRLTVTSPPYFQRPKFGDCDALALTPHPDRKRASRARAIEVVVETLPVGAVASQSSSAPPPPPRESSIAEPNWRVRHMRCDNVEMPTALRVQPNSDSFVLQDQVHVQPGEEVVILQSQRDKANSNILWTQISCVQGQGWIKQDHLREGGWYMRHKRSDNARIQTALREKPSASSTPLLTVKADVDERVLVHCMLDIEEEGWVTSWVRIACKMGEGWIKREHLQIVSQKRELEKSGGLEIQIAVAPTTPRSDDSILTQPAAPHDVKISGVQSKAPEIYAYDSQFSAVEKVSEIEACDSEVAATGVRIHVGTLEFASNSVGSMGMFDTVGFRAIVQLCGSDGNDAPPRWIDEGPCTGARTLNYSRAISEAGQYSAKFRCLFDDAFDIPWPPPSPTPEKIAVDIFLERTTVVDRFDRVLGGLGLHTPAGMDRRWLGRAMADLPPEGVDDVPFAWSIESSSAADCPVPQTVTIGVEWVYQPLEEL